MILIFHITLATVSIIYSGYLFFRPSFSGLKIAYAFIALTIISGCYMILTRSVNITETCQTGLVYTALVLAGTAAARHKLQKNDRHSLV